MRAFANGRAGTGDGHRHASSSHRRAETGRANLGGRPLRPIAADPGWRVIVIMTIAIMDRQEIRGVCAIFAGHREPSKCRADAFFVGSAWLRAPTCRAARLFGHASEESKAGTGAVRHPEVRAVRHRGTARRALRGYQTPRNCVQGSRSGTFCAQRLQMRREGCQTPRNCGAARHPGTAGGCQT